MTRRRADKAWSDRWFVAGCGFELVLGAMAGGLAWVFHVPLWSAIRWHGVDALVGILATLPLVGLLAWTLSGRSTLTRSVVEFLDQNVVPIFARWSGLQLALLATLAGVGEELLFRGVLQGGLARYLPSTVALLLAGALFGGAHAVNRAYALLATGMGIYLGWLWVWRDNLLTPMVTHGVYDFIALLWIIRRHKPLQHRSDH